MQPFVLQNEHVRLSVPTAADVDRVTACCQDPDVAAWTVVPSPYTRQDGEDFVTGYVLDGWARGTTFTWAVRAPGAADGPVLGMVGLGVDDAPEGQRSAEIGYWTAREARGRGLTTHAARLAVDWGLDPEGLGLARVFWQAYVGNWGSRRVAWRLGFRTEGTVRGFALQRGRRRDAWLGTLLPGDPREPVEPWPDGAPTTTPPTPPTPMTSPGAASSTPARG